MRRVTTLVLVILAAGGLATGACAQGVWHDPSPHRSQFVAVTRDVHLEVLDWGGSGPALVFLAGYGNSAHIYDDFVPRFMDKFRVLGISRREFGGSSRRVDGYDSSALARDVITVLDSLGLVGANFVAHSFGGSELNYLGAHYPGRVGKLVYIDAAFDFARLYADPRWTKLFPLPEPALGPYWEESVRMYSLLAERLSGPGYPATELPQMFDIDTTGQVLGRQQPPGLATSFQQGTLPAEFTRIRMPMLALYADPQTAPVAYTYWNSMDSTERARLQQAFAVMSAVTEEQIAMFGAGVSQSRVVRIPGGRHYLFLTDPGEVAHEMRVFFAAN